MIANATGSDYVGGSVNGDIAVSGNEGDGMTKTK